MFNKMYAVHSSYDDMLAWRFGANGWIQCGLNQNKHKSRWIFNDDDGNSSSDNSSDTENNDDIT